MDIADASAWVIPVVLAVTLHEAAHGWMAERFGDDTARQMGRVTFNPLKHIDRFGTIIFPALLLLMHSPIVFGYAKPVPVNFNRLTPPRLGMFMVAIAGVLTNLIMAFAAALLLHVDQFTTPEQSPWLFQNLYRALMINCVLAVFNMIPVMPLDGGRAVNAFLSGRARKIYCMTEKRNIGVFIVIACIMIPGLLGLDIMEKLLGAPIYWLIDHMLWLSGNTQPDSQ